MATCRYLSKKQDPTTLKDAKANSYTACTVCRPLWINDSLAGGCLYSTLAECLAAPVINYMKLPPPELGFKMTNPQKGGPETRFALSPKWALSCFGKRLYLRVTKPTANFLAIWRYESP